ncbi:transposase (plasmid) [Clostridium estertheticum]|uniref:Tn3 family transposase n=1 Tax=Clostridium estertheticum TaxID=238834 RepID=UPI001C0AB9C2|nr:Tn3 family transposase [Clostridium estertheticum]MBU3217708.1 transposase [Clostridium estertheticum]WAG58313.1 transposase [Clostridium estertheticum]
MDLGGFESYTTAVSDQSSRFGGGVINTNSRDAIHVVDILLSHNTELDIYLKLLSRKS